MLKVAGKTLLAAAVFAVASPAVAQDTIKMGGLATLEGAFAAPGQDSIRGIRMALEEHKYTAGGKKIELITGSSDASPASAIRATRKLVEQDGVQVM
ncbi:MAG: ABC transporter substrate-binding protein, partial [Rhodospirillaceae bacterium]|nr:ABC transporter substrate-binding protein [Rhodospirillaceae bacterium]